MATPASPIAPERESGVIFKKGTAVGIAVELVPFVFTPEVCAIASEGRKMEIKKIIVLFGKNFICAI